MADPRDRCNPHGATRSMDYIPTGNPPFLPVFILAIPTVVGTLIQKKNRFSCSGGCTSPGPRAVHECSKETQCRPGGPSARLLQNGYSTRAKGSRHAPQGTPRSSTPRLHGMPAHCYDWIKPADALSPPMLKRRPKREAGAADRQWFGIELGVPEPKRMVWSSVNSRSACMAAAINHWLRVLRTAGACAGNVLVCTAACLKRHVFSHCGALAHESRHSFLHSSIFAAPRPFSLRQ